MNTAAAPAPARPSRRRRAAWVVGALLGVVVLGAGVFVWSQRSDIDKVLAETDRLDPGWRFDNLLASRAPVPDDRNAAVLGAKVLLLYGSKNITLKAQEYELFEKLPAAAQLNDRQYAILRQHADKTPAVWPEALKLKDFPEGRYPIGHAKDWASTLLGPLQDARTVSFLLSLDTALRAQEGDADGALEACHATVNLGRSVADEPGMMPYLIRTAIQGEGLRAGLERVLAQTQPSEAVLAGFQNALAREASEPAFLRGLRGDRAGRDVIFHSIISGEVPFKNVALLNQWRQRKPSVVQEALYRFAPGSLTADRAECLRAYNRFVEAAKLPTERQPEAFEEAEAASGNAIPNVTLVPTLSKLVVHDVRHQALLRSAAAAVAAERYRRQHGDWPAGLEALVKAGLLREVPADPFDDRPLRWRRLPDGIVIYSVGLDRLDNGGRLDGRDMAASAPGTDAGFRLWDVPARRQPPLPIRVMNDH
jgi:hypothetical protein